MKEKYIVYCCTGCLGTENERSCALEVLEGDITPKRCVVTGTIEKWIKDITRERFTE